MANFLVEVFQQHIEIDLVPSVSSYDWQCEINGELVSYKIKVDRDVESKKLGRERANVAIVNHAIDYAGGAVIAWKTCGFVAKKADAKRKEIQSQMRRLL